MVKAYVSSRRSAARGLSASPLHPPFALSASPLHPPFALSARGARRSSTAVTDSVIVSRSLSVSLVRRLLGQTADSPPPPDTPGAAYQAAASGAWQRRGLIGYFQIQFLATLIEINNFVGYRWIQSTVGNQWYNFVA